MECTEVFNGVCMQYSVDDFDYECPEHLIAQRPTPERDGSRLLVLRGAEVAHKNFIEFPDLLEPGDLVVVNASKVIKARLKGIRENGRVAEILLGRLRSESLRSGSLRGNAG